MTPDDGAPAPGPCSPLLAHLLEAPRSQQLDRGYYHTIREICHQPETWVETARCLSEGAAPLREALQQGPFARALLTGSGSSHYVGCCVAPALQRRLGIDVRAVPAGSLLLDPEAYLGANRSLVVSFSRSGRSPESRGVLDLSLSGEWDVRHLIVTCSADGALAGSHGDDARIRRMVLDDRTCDRSLVMTSSFTNLAIVGQGLGRLGEPAAFASTVTQLARLARRVLAHQVETLAHAAAMPYDAVVFLGSGGRQGAALESALKMLEMTAGRVRTQAETYLGLRHGPMTAVRDDTLVVCFVSSDACRRAYELEVIRELGAKRLGLRKVVVGDRVPRECLADEDVAVPYEDVGILRDDEMTVVDVLVGQLLGFFRCLHEGLAPDAPSPQAVITRVVPPFTLHRRPGS